MELLAAVAAVLVVVGLIGVIVPVLPGTPLIYAGALLYDYTQGWSALGWGWLALLCVLMLVAEVGDWWLGNIGAKRGGASWRAILVGTVLSLIGTFLLPPFGFLIGAIVGVVGTELILSSDTRHALRAGGGWLLGWVLSLLLQGTMGVLMVAIIVWQAR